MTVKLNNRDYIWSYIGVFMSVGASAIMLPFILYFLDEDMYGLWSVFQSVAAITALFDFGFSTTFARNINYCWCGAEKLKKTGAVFSRSEEPNFLLMKKTMAACRYVFLILSGVAFICMAGPGTFYIWYISRDLPGLEPFIAWGLYALAVFLNLYYGYYNSFLRGVGAISDANRVTVVSKLVQILLTVILLACGLGIIGTGIAYLVFGFLYRILSRKAFLRFQGIGEELDRVEQKTTKDEIREIFFVVWHNAGREGVVTLSNYLANQACTLLCPIYISLRATGIYSLAVQLATVLSNVAGALYSANQPVLQSSYITNDEDAVRRAMSLIVVSYVGLYMVGMAAIVTVGLPLIRLIKPDSTPSVVVMLGVGAYQFVLKFRNCYTSYFSCTNRIPYVRSFIVSSIIGVILAVVMLELGWGMWGLILSQLISQMAYNAWHWTLKAHQEMELGLGSTWSYGWEGLRKIAWGFFHTKDLKD